MVGIAKLKYALRLFITGQLLVVSTTVFAQFNLPSVQVLQDSNVKAIKVYRQAIKYVGGPEKERLEFGLPDTSRLLYQWYEFNEFGMADSLMNYQKHLYSYDGKDMVAYEVRDRSGLIRNHGVISRLANHEIHSSHYELGKLKSTARFDADSILVEQLHYYNDTNWRYAIRFDPTQNLRTEHWRSEDGSYKIETYQWFTVDGKPNSFTHTLEEREKGKTKLIQKQKTYPLDSAGNVVNKYLGRFDDPYLRYNFNRRLDKFKPLKFNNQERFREDHLVTVMINEELYTFSGIELVVRYEFEYEFR